MKKKRDYEEIGCEEKQRRPQKPLFPKAFDDQLHKTLNNQVCHICRDANIRNGETPQLVCLRDAAKRNDLAVQAVEELVRVLRAGLQGR